jgi:hypothetical protein
MQSADEQERIRAVFLERRDRYSLCDAANLLGLPYLRLRADIEAQEYDATPTADGYVLTWAQLAYIAVVRWELEAIYAALGDDAERVLPPLLRVREVTAALPEYMVRLLQMLAAEQHMSLSEYLRWQLLNLAQCANSTEIEKLIPGFRAALMFPDPP